MRSTATAKTPVAITVAISMVSLFMTGLLFVIRHTIGKLTAALVRDVSTVALPASHALILPCMAIVAAAAVVLALLTRPPKTPEANMP
jgi:hypothetical protein